MRLANELAALAMDFTREHMRPGMKESEVGGMYEGFVHGLGVGLQGQSRDGACLHAGLVGQGNRDIHCGRAIVPFSRTNRHYLRSGYALTATGQI